MSTQRKRLGKGLGALLGETAVSAARGEDSADVTQVAVARIAPNRFQPRRAFADEAIAELAASITRVGILQPLIVAPREDGSYELVSGERRLRAARQVGLATVPVVVREVDDRELLEIALIENLQREDLDAIEEAEGYRRLIDEFDLTQAEIATQVGRSRPAVANALRLLDLPDEVQALVRDGSLSAGHARSLLAIDNRRRIPELARRAASEGLSVRQVEALVRRENAGPRPDAPPSAADLERQRIEEDLQRDLGTRVRIHASRKGKGRIEIAFYSLEDFERIVAVLHGTGP